MLDREKIIKGIEECNLNGGLIGNCPYKGILTLLKEQEAVEPYQRDAVWLCGNCEKEVVGWDDDIEGEEYRYPFCRQCGKPVLWEGR